MQTNLADVPNQRPAHRSGRLPSSPSPDLPAAARRAHARRQAGACLAPALAVAALLTGCARPPAPPLARRPNLPVYAIDLAGGAKLCAVSQTQPIAGKTVSASMKVGNDGGWCGLPVAQRGKGGPLPYAAGLLLRPARHGTVYIHSVGDETRIDYTPQRGFVGSDSFTVSLIPGRPTITVQVTVVG